MVLRRVEAEQLGAASGVELLGSLLEPAQALPLRVELGTLRIQALANEGNLTLERARAPIAQQPPRDASRRQVDLRQLPLQLLQRPCGDAHLPLDLQDLEPALGDPASALRSASPRVRDLELLDECRPVLDEHRRAKRTRRFGRNAVFSRRERARRSRPRRTDGRSCRAAGRRELEQHALGFVAVGNRIGAVGEQERDLCGRQPGREELEERLGRLGRRDALELGSEVRENRVVGEERLPAAGERAVLVLDGTRRTAP